MTKKNILLKIAIKTQSIYFCFQNNLIRILFSKLQNQIEILQRKIYDNQSENSEFLVI